MCKWTDFSKKQSTIRKAPLGFSEEGKVGAEATEERLAKAKGIEA